MSLHSKKNMALVAGNLALDFVNTATSEHLSSYQAADYLTDVSAVLDFCQNAQIVDESTFCSLESTIISDSRLGTDFFASAMRMRDALNRIFSAAISKSKPEDGDLNILNEILLQAHLVERLTWIDDGIHMVYDIGTENALNRLLWTIAIAAKSLLLGPQLKQIKECGSSTCSWLFLDQSKNYSRRWCQMDVCGNREKGRRRLKRECSVL